MKFDEKVSSLMEGFTPKQLLMMAGVAGLLTFAVLYWGLSHLIGNDEKKEQPQQPPMQMVKVVQAKTDIKAREQIKESMLQLVEVPTSMLPAGALTEIQGLAGRPTRVAILAGDILTEKKLYQDVKDSGFTGVIPPDRRAMSIAVTDVTGVSGFLKPGDYVDVMFITEKMDSTRITGEVILQNVLLLGVNNTAQRTEGQQQEAKSSDLKGKLDNALTGEKPMTATLAVRPEEELRLAVAARAGQLYLALRPYKPANMYMLDTEYSFNKGRATPTAPPAAAPMPSAAQGAPASFGDASDPGSQMEIIRGTKSSRGK